MLPGDGVGPTPGVHQVTANPTALGRGSLMLLIQLFLSNSGNMVWHTELGAQQRVT